MACGILVPWPGIKPAPPAVEVQSWTTRPPGKSHSAIFERVVGSQPSGVPAVHVQQVARPPLSLWRARWSGRILVQGCLPSTWHHAHLQLLILLCCSTAGVSLPLWSLPCPSAKVPTSCCHLRHVLNSPSTQSPQLCPSFPKGNPTPPSTQAENGHQPWLILPVQLVPRSSESLMQWHH